MKKMPGQLETNHGGSQASCDSPNVGVRRVNNKNCGQCDVVFQKSQKSLNCNMCNYWFCLACSHVSNKVYDVIKKEQIANLPFNRDGCRRIIPKLTELGSIINEQIEATGNL